MKRLAAVPTSAFLALALAACAGGEEPDTESDPSSTPSSSAASTPDVPEPTYLDAGQLPNDLSLRDVRARTIPSRPFADFTVAVGDGVWVSGVAPGAVRYDARGRITARTRIPGDVVQALAADAETGTVYVPSLNPSLLFAVDAVTGEVLARVALPASPVAEAAVGAADNRAYVLVEPSEPRIVVVEGDEVVEELPAPEGAVAVRAGYGSLWVPTGNDTLERYDLASRSWSTVRVGPDPRFLDVGFDAVWVMDQGDGSVARVDATTGAVEQIPFTGERIGGGDLTVGAGAVWLRTDSAVVRIDPDTRAATHVISPPPGSASAAAVDDFLLISNHDHDVVHVVPLPLPR